MRTVKYRILPILNASPAAAAVTGNCTGCRTALSGHGTRFAIRSERNHKASHNERKQNSSQNAHMQQR